MADPNRQLSAGEITDIFRKIEDQTDELDTLRVDLWQGIRTHPKSNELIAFLRELSDGIDKLIQDAEEKLELLTK